MGTRLGACRRRPWPAVAGLATALVLAACGQHASSPRAGSSSTSLPGDHRSGRYDPTKADFAQIHALLARRSSAVAHHREAEFLATVDSRNASLTHQQRTLYENLSRLGVTSLRYDADTSSLLVPVRVAGNDPTLRPDVVEHVRIPDTTTHPISNPVEDTFVKRDGHWLLGAETSSTDESSFEAPQERPWAGVPITVRRSGPLTVLMDAPASTRITTLTTAVRDDIAHDALLLGVVPAYAVLVDATTNGVSHALNSLTQEDAAAVTKGMFYEPHGDDSRARLAGTVIKVNPDTVDSVLARPDILRHELTHYLLREYLGSSPRWLVEGVAAWVQYYPDDFAALQVPPALYDKIMHADHELPPEGLFYDDPAVDYPIGQAAVAWLVSHYGTAKLLALMRAYRDRYQGVDIDPLTPKVLREVDGVSQAQVVAGAFGLLATFHH